MTPHPVFRLGDIADVAAGDPAPQDADAFAPDGPLFVRMQDVGRNHVNPALRASADRLDPAWLRRNRLRLFPRDSVLVPKSGASVNLNHRAKLATDAYVVSHLAVVVADRTRIDPDYLFWWSVRYDPREQVQVTSLPSLKLSTLKEARIPVPTLREQRRIAGILNRSARVECLTAEAAKLAHKLAPMLFIEMFGDPAENPLGWPVRSFSDIVKDNTKKAEKIQKKDYRERGRVQIIDQGKIKVAGWTNGTKGMYSGSLPAVVFGDHTRRFKLVREPFFLGADGAKLLVPKANDVDPVFLYGQFLCLKMKDAGYSRHFKFLKAMNLVAPPVDKQKRFRELLDKVERVEGDVEKAGEIALNLRTSLMAHLLEQNR